MVSPRRGRTAELNKLRSVMTKGSMFQRSTRVSPQFGHESVKGLAAGTIKQYHVYPPEATGFRGEQVGREAD